MSKTANDSKTVYTCSTCGAKEWLDYYEAQRKGWYWERRVGIWYDFYCPKHDPRKRIIIDPAPNIR